VNKLRKAIIIWLLLMAVSFLINRVYYKKYQEESLKAIVAYDAARIESRVSHDVLRTLSPVEQKYLIILNTFGASFLCFMVIAPIHVFIVFKRSRS